MSRDPRQSSKAHNSTQGRLRLNAASSVASETKRTVAHRHSSPSHTRHLHEDGAGSRLELWAIPRLGQARGVFLRAPVVGQQGKEHAPGHARAAAATRTPTTAALRVAGAACLAAAAEGRRLQCILRACAAAAAARLLRAASAAALLASRTSWRLICRAFATRGIAITATSAAECAAVEQALQLVAALVNLQAKPVSYLRHLLYQWEVWHDLPTDGRAATAATRPKRALGQCASSRPFVTPCRPGASAVGPLLERLHRCAMRRFSRSATTRLKPSYA
jgi:hypothetical protein